MSIGQKIWARCWTSIITWEKKEFTYRGVDDQDGLYFPLLNKWMVVIEAVGAGMVNGAFNGICINSLNSLVF